MSKLDELKRLEARATKGPWKDWIEYRGARRTNIIARKDDPLHSIGSVNVNDSEFIAAARNALPALLRVVEAAREYYMARSCYTDGAVKDRLRDALRELEGDK